MRMNSDTQKGFSLIEVLVASAVFAVIVTAALLMYDRSNRVFKTGIENSNLQQNTRVAFEQMMSDVRMAGFDYDRDGIPGGTNQFQQPDEQIEFIGRNALTIRGNFDYEANRQPCTADPANPIECENGRERGYEPTTGQFPLVTTGNDEIVTYALQSRNTAANTGTISFFADTARPRRSYGGGAIEDTVTITGVDLTNDNPPYTLVRYSLRDDGTVLSAPIADNIRSLDFLYYEDTTGTQLLRSLDTTPVTYTPVQYQTLVGGLGQYDPANTTVQLPQRNVRAKIQSVRVSLVGMNEAPDGAYTDATETVAAVKNYRKFRLNTLIVPRNAGRRGTVEQEYRAPGAPSITRVCYGYCGVVYIEWEAPTGGNSGAPDQYAVLYNTSASGGFSNIEYAGNVLSTFITLPDPSASYYFAVEAINSYGASVSAMMPGSSSPGISMRNATTPNVPTDLVASGGTLPIEENQIRLRWKAPTVQASGTTSCTMGSAPSTTPTAEIKGFRVQRKKVTETTWPTWPDGKVVDENSTLPFAPDFNVFTGDVTFVDTSAANCVRYDYRIATMERCPDAGQNTGGAVGLSAWSAIVQGESQATTQPGTPTTLTVVAADSSCPNGAGDCTIKLTWPVVNTDVLGRPVTIDTYRITRVRKVSNNASYAADLGDIVIGAGTANAVYTSSNIVFTDTPRYADPSDPLSGGVGNGDYYFEYQVRAEQCTAPPGDYSPIAKFPCTYTGGVLTAGISPGAAVIQGNGGAANPWLIDSPANLDVVSTGLMNRLSATYISSGGTSLQLGIVSGPPTFSTASFAIPSLSSGDAGRIVLTARDINNCTTTVIYYVQEAGSNCCLVPDDLETSLEFVDPTVDAAFYRLKNICNVPLTIISVTTHWNTTFVTDNPAPRVNIGFPTALGGAVNPATLTYDNASGGSGSTANPVTMNLSGGGVTTIPIDATSNSDDYWIRLRYSRDFGATANNPTRSVCIVYRRSDELTNRTCRIDPTPSPTPDTCPAP